MRACRHQGADERDAGDRISRRHQRGMKERGDPRDNLIAEKGRQDENVKRGNDCFRGHLRRSQEFGTSGVQERRWKGGMELHDGEETFGFLNEVIHPHAWYEELSSVSSRELVGKFVCGSPPGGKDGSD